MPKTLKKEALRFRRDVKTIGHLEIAKSFVKPRELALRRMQADDGKSLQEM